MVFQFEVTYFKPSGKFYIREPFELDVTPIGQPPHQSAYMNNVVDYLKQCRRDRTLPGLQSGYWDGFVLVDSENGYPCLILPEGTTCD